MTPPHEHRPAGDGHGRHAWAPARLAVAAGAVIALAASLRAIGPTAAVDSTTFAATGPSVVQLQRLRALVTARVHVADVLVGESRWLRGCWVVRGDALLAVDMTRARVEARDERARTAVVVLPPPAVLSARVDHDGTREWDVTSRTWVPLAAALLGDPRALRAQAMREAQRLVGRAASDPAHVQTARRHAEGALRDFYAAVGWRVSVQWQDGDAAGR